LLSGIKAQTIEFQSTDESGSPTSPHFCQQAVEKVICEGKAYKHPDVFEDRLPRQPFFNSLSMARSGGSAGTAAFRFSTVRNSGSA